MDESLAFNAHFWLKLGSNNQWALLWLKCGSSRYDSDHMESDHNQFKSIKNGLIFVQISRV